MQSKADYNFFPYISIITPARNDDYINDGIARLQFSIDILAKQIEQHKIETEIILVDYNFPSSEGKLIKNLIFQEKSKYLTIRIVEVPPKYHNRFNDFDKCPFHGAIATNVGFTRARGEFLVLRNSDILWSEELLNLISKKKFDPDAKYRCTRFDISSDILHLKARSLDQIYLFVKNNITSKMINIPYYVHGLPHLRVNSNGDFQLMSAANMKKLRGYEESDIINAPYCDGYLEFCSYVAGIKDVLMDNLHVYKIEHAGSYKHRVLESIFPFYKKIIKLIPPNLFGHKFIKLCRRSGLTNLLYDNLTHYKSGIRQPTRKEYYNKCRKIVNGQINYILNGPQWGLNNVELDEYKIMTATSWDL